MFCLCSGSDAAVMKSQGRSERAKRILLKVHGQNRGFICPLLPCWNVDPNGTAMILINNKKNKYFSCPGAGNKWLRLMFIIHWQTYTKKALGNAFEVFCLSVAIGMLSSAAWIIDSTYNQASLILQAAAEMVNIKLQLCFLFLSMHWVLLICFYWCHCW